MPVFLRLHIADLIWCVTLIAAGLGCLRLAQATDNGFLLLKCVLWIMGGAFGFAGLLAPIKKKRIGAVIGIVIQAIVIFFVVWDFLSRVSVHGLTD